MTPTDDAMQRNVAVIGTLLARQMFPGMDPLGNPFEVDGQPFTVVGVLYADSRVAGAPVNFTAYLPLETARARFGPVRGARQGVGDQVDDFLAGRARARKHRPGRRGQPHPPRGGLPHTRRPRMLKSACRWN